MSKIKPIWEHGSVHPDSPNKVFCTAPWTHTYISPQSERRMCCASREEHQFQKQYIDASNDEKYGEVKESGTIADYKPVSLKEHWNSPPTQYISSTMPLQMASQNSSSTTSF